MTGRAPNMVDAVDLCDLFEMEIAEARAELPPNKPKRRGSSRPRVDKCEKCFYCDMPLAPTHHHDHFPLPYRYGGKVTVPACVNCHILKDSVDFDTWPGLGGLAIMGEIVKKLTPVERILFAKMATVTIDALAKTRKPGDR